MIPTRCTSITWPTYRYAENQSRSLILLLKKTKRLQTKKKIQGQYLFSNPAKSLNVLFCAPIKRYITCCELEAVYVEHNPACGSPRFSKLLPCAQQKCETIYCATWKSKRGNIWTALRTNLISFLLAQTWGCFLDF